MAETPELRHNYDSIIFDIDGTLWNAAQSTAVAWTDVFRKHGIPKQVTKSDIESVAGRPYLDCLRIIFKDFDSFPDQQTLLTDLTISEQESMKALGGELYPGVADGLAKLAKKYPLYLVSNCQDWYLESFLNHLDLRKHFKDSTCFGLTQLPKAQNIALVVERNCLTAPVYVGDTLGDQSAAAAAGIPYFHVSYGFEKKKLESTTFACFADLTTSLIGLHSLGE